MKCNNCGAPLQLDQKFCPNCGSPNEQGLKHANDMRTIIESLTGQEAR